MSKHHLSLRRAQNLISLKLLVCSSARLLAQKIEMIRQFEALMMISSNFFPIFQSGKNEELAFN